MKNTHQYGGVRPVKMIKAIAFFKDKKNPHYDGVMIKCMFCGIVFEDGSTNVLNHVENCHVDVQATDTSEDIIATQTETEAENLEESRVFAAVKNI